MDKIQTCNEVMKLCAQVIDNNRNRNTPRAKQKRKICRAVKQTLRRVKANEAARLAAGRAEHNYKLQQRRRQLLKTINRIRTQEVI